MVRIFLLFQSLQLAFLVLEDVREESRICGKKRFLYQDSDFFSLFSRFCLWRIWKEDEKSKKICKLCYFSYT